MRDTLLPEPALLQDDAEQILGPLSLGSVKLYPAPPLTRFVLRARPELLPQAAAAWGLAPPEPLRVSSVKDRHLHWQGPDEWLLLARADEHEEIRTQLTDAMGSHAHALVDVSHRNQAFLLTGEGVEALLATACMLDLCLQAFPVGMTTRTVFAKAELTLWRIDEHTFHIEIWRSFAPYVIGILKKSALWA